MVFSKNFATINFSRQCKLEHVFNLRLSLESFKVRVPEEISFGRVLKEKLLDTTNTFLLSPAEIFDF